MSAWRPVTERGFDPQPAPADGIDFVLTPRERDMAAIWRCQIEANKRAMNRRENAQAAAHALSREEAA